MSKSTECTMSFQRKQVLEFGFKIIKLEEKGNTSIVTSSRLSSSKRKVIRQSWRAWNCRVRRERQYAGCDGHMLPILRIPWLGCRANESQAQANRQYSYLQSVVHQATLFVTLKVACQNMGGIQWAFCWRRTLTTRSNAQTWCTCTLTPIRTPFTSLFLYRSLTSSLRSCSIAMTIKSLSASITSTTKTRRTTTWTWSGFAKRWRRRLFWSATW